MKVCIVVVDNHRVYGTGKQSGETSDLAESIGLTDDSLPREPRARRVAGWLRAYAARPSLVERLLSRMLVKNPHVGLAVFFTIGSLGVGYLWASAFGDGLKGALSGAALDNAPSYPDADAVMVISLAASCVGYFFATAAAAKVFDWSASRVIQRMLGMGGLMAAAGLALFAVSRLFV